MENIIIYPAFNKFRNSEYIQFFDDVSIICQTNDPVTLQIETTLNDFTTAFAPLGQTYKQVQRSDLTEDISIFDARRDTGTSCLKGLASYYCIHFDPEKAKAGEAILAAIDKYGKNITRQNYLEETTSLKHLSKDLTTDPTLIAAVTLLGLDDLVTEIITANNGFQTTHLARVNSKAAKTQPTLSELIPDVVKAYRRLTSRIAAHYVLNSSEAYTVLINQINTLIEKYNETVNQRSKKTESEADTTPTQENGLQSKNESDPPATPAEEE